MADDPTTFAGFETFLNDELFFQTTDGSPFAEDVIYYSDGRWDQPGQTITGIFVETEPDNGVRMGTLEIDATTDPKPTVDSSFNINGTGWIVRQDKGIGPIQAGWITVALTTREQHGHRPG